MKKTTKGTKGTAKADKASPYAIKGKDVTGACIGVIEQLLANAEQNGGKGRAYANKKGVEMFCKGVARSNLNPDVPTLKNLLVNGHGLSTMKQDMEFNAEGEAVKVWVAPADKVAWTEVLDLLEERGKIVQVRKMAYLPADAPDTQKQKEAKAAKAAKLQVKANSQYHDKAASLL
jgi:hypothetical protein